MLGQKAAGNVPSGITRPLNCSVLTIVFLVDFMIFFKKRNKIKIKSNQPLVHVCYMYHLRPELKLTDMTDHL